ncbi:ROK family protein [Actinoplanes sp. NPDC049265]|uniref:ROK family transcriptional regulator n=1 Tax=Actinoplanes sp. NPDC049265 TaxID=3363902 RepID=UPI003721EBD2
MTDPDRALPQAVLRAATDRRLLDETIRRGRTTRAELAAETGYSRPTVSEAVRRMVAQGLLDASGLNETGRRGRVGTFYSLGARAGWVLGLEISQTGVRARATDLAGTILHEETNPPTSPGDVPELVASVRSLTRRMSVISGTALATAPTPSATDPTTPPSTGSASPSAGPPPSSSGTTPPSAGASSPSADGPLPSFSGAGSSSTSGASPSPSGAASPSTSGASRSASSASPSPSGAAPHSARGASPFSHPAGVSAGPSRAGFAAGRGPLRAIGISLANPVDPSTQAVVPLPGTPFPEGLLSPEHMLADLTDAPILVDNDVNLAALAEHRLGRAAGESSFAYVYLGAGIGVGLYLGHQLIRGAHGLAGEIGYLPGIVSPTLSGDLRAGGFDRKDAPAIDVNSILALLDRPSETAVRQLAEATSRAIVSVAAVVDPALFLLGGPVGTHPALLPAVRELMTFPGPPRIEHGALGADAPLTGALQLALEFARAAATAP